MSTKVPEKLLVNGLLKRLQESNKEWSTKTLDDGSVVLDTTEHNTAIVMKALRESARESGYISLMLLLLTCKVES